MSKHCMILTLCAGLALLGCEDDVTEPNEFATPDVQLGHVGDGVLASLTGGGQIREGNLVIKFAFTDIQRSADGTASGRFRFSVIFQDELVEFHGRTTCVTFDEANNRAWVGGVITQNNSTHPFWMRDINDVGRDIWFRAVDYGEGANAPQNDRSTFVGFEGNAGIPTSEEYCEQQIWPAGDARTGAVTQGNIQVRH